MTAPEFHRPGQASSSSTNDSPFLPDLEGSLCVFRLNNIQENFKTKFGTKIAVFLDTLVVDGVEAGTVSEMPPRKRGESANVLADHTGKFYPKVLSLQGYVNGEFTRQSPGFMLIGVVDIEEKDSKAAGGMADTWVIKEPTDAEFASAVAYYEAHPMPDLVTYGRPASSTTTAPAEQGSDSRRTSTRRRASEGTAKVSGVTEIGSNPAEID